MEETKPLLGKTAIVTGASRGIGRAIALRLAEEGARCVFCGRDTEALAEAVDDVRASGGEAEWIALDLREPGAPGQLVDFAISRFGGADVVVSNAGATKRGEFVALTDADWADGFALKFFGAVRLARAAWPHLQASRGSLVMVSGIGGRTPGALFSVGGSVNAALLSLTKSLAETGLKDGIQVNAVNPGAVRTDRLRKRLAELAAQEGIELSVAEKHFIAAEKVTRIGEPEDIANLVAFIVSPRGRFLHGALLDMDGGATKTI